MSEIASHNNREREQEKSITLLKTPEITNFKYALIGCKTFTSLLKSLLVCPPLTKSGSRTRCDVTKHAHKCVKMAFNLISGVLNLK